MHRAPGPERPWLQRLLDRPSSETFRRLLWLNAAVVFLALTVGGPLGDLKRRSFGPGAVLHAVCSAEVLCTLASFAQLLLAAYVLREVYHLRRDECLRATGKRGPSLLWLLMWLGFVFLAIDEVAFVHEGIDKLVHWVFAIQETSLTDRLDDLLPGVYALVGLSVLYRYRAELKPFHGFWPWLTAGMLLMVAMIGLDVLTNRKDVLTVWIADRGLALFWWAKLSALEEGCKIFAEACFLGLFLRCLETARARGTPALLPFPRPATRQTAA